MAGKDVGFEWLADTAAFVPVLATHLYKDRCSDYVPIETEESDGDSPGRNKRDDDGVKLREMVLFVPGCGESRVQDLLEVRQCSSGESVGLVHVVATDVDLPMMRRAQKRYRSELQLQGSFRKNGFSSGSHCTPLEWFKVDLGSAATEVDGGEDEKAGLQRQTPRAQAQSSASSAENAGDSGEGARNPDENGSATTSSYYTATRRPASKDDTRCMTSVPFGSFVTDVLLSWKTDSVTRKVLQVNDETEREQLCTSPAFFHPTPSKQTQTLKVDVMTFDKGTLDFFLTQETSRLAEYLRNIATATSVESTYLVVSFRGARFVKTIVESGGEFQMSRVWTDVDGLECAAFQGTKHGQKHTCVAFTRLCRSSAGIFNYTGSNYSLHAAEAHEHAQKLHKIIDQHYKTGPGRMKKPEMLRVRTSQTDGRAERAECQDADAAPLKMELPDENAGKAKDEAGTSTEQQNEQKQLSLEEAYDAAIGEGLRAEYPFAYFLEDLRATQPAAADRGRLTQEDLDQFVEENM